MFGPKAPGVNSYARRQARDSTQKLPNQLAFLAHTTPGVPIRTSYSVPTPYFLLEELWKAFDEPSAFGVEIPFRLGSEDGSTGEVAQCYVPYLSAIQLFEQDSRWSRPPRCDDSSDEDLCQESLSSDARSTSSIASSVASTSTGSDEDKTAPTPRSICERHHTRPRGKHLLFEFYETAAPHTREPLTDRIRQLAREAECPELLSMRSHELHPHSWFAVAWYPLYQIPAGQCLKELSACFLTFHSLSLPGPTAHLHSSIPRGLQPHHPFSKALNQLGADSHPPTPAPAVAAAAAPILEQRQLCTMRMSGHGLIYPTPLAFLLPFACMPYKAQGRAWLDSEPAACLHHTMATAALAWNQHMACKHPDLEFFSHQLKAPASSSGSSSSGRSC